MNYAALCLASLTLLVSNSKCIVVEVEQGQLQGEKLRVVTGDVEYYSFKGIPYAKPPTGDLRFLAPQPPEPWTGVRNATQHGSMCVQRYKYNIQNIVGSEDCLFLNVYTPNIKPKILKAVMIYIHGGGFESGSGNVERHGPDYLVTEDIVLVTINYRLGALGFLALNTAEVPGNAGIKDQVAAMRWVQKNIAAFGGDPNKVTIFGESVGAASVGYHNLSPMTKGLYRRSIVMSGGPLNDWAGPFEPKRIAFRLGQQLGLWTLEEDELVEFLKSVPAEELLTQDPTILTSEEPNIIFKQILFAPTLETWSGADKFMTIDPIDALKTGAVNDVELMIGHTDLEGLFFMIYIDSESLQRYGNFSEMVVPRKILENTIPKNYFPLADIIRTKYFGDNRVDEKVAKDIVTYISDTAINYGVIKYAKLFSKLRTTFVYKFSILTDFPRYIDLTNKYGINGPTHEDDLYYLFYPHGSNVTITKNSEQYKLVKQVCALYANFAKYGNPTFTESLGIKWPEYNNTNQYYLDIDKTLTIGERLDEEVVEFWDGIYKTAGLGF